MSMRRTRTLSRHLSLLALGALLAIPALAQPTLNPGTVLLSTPAGAGTAVDFAGTPLPADFFCPGSAPFGGVVPLQGVPLATNPPGIAGGADTIVEHLTTGTFSGGVASFAAVLRAMHLRSSGNLSIVCGDGTTTSWRVDVCACGPQTATKIVAKLDPACNNCGTAGGTLAVSVCVTFTDVNSGRVLGPVRQNLTMNLVNSTTGPTPWCFKAGQNEPVANVPFQVDTNCDNQPDLTVRPSANFHTGYKCATQGADCLALFGSLTHCHENFSDPTSDHLHCVNPVCDKRQ
jgi:hypothetical protein